MPSHVDIQLSEVCQGVVELTALLSAKEAEVEEIKQCLSRKQDELRQLNLSSTDDTITQYKETASLSTPVSEEIVSSRFVWPRAPIYVSWAIERAKQVAWCHWPDRRITLNPLVSDRIWSEFIIRTGAKEQGKLRIQRIKEAIEIALKKSDSPSVGEITKIIKERCKEGYDCPMASDNYYYNLHMWFYYMNHQGLITITPSIPL
jgi:hypothetical protein